MNSLSHVFTESQMGIVGIVCSLALFFVELDEEDKEAMSFFSSIFN